MFAQLQAEMETYAINSDKLYVSKRALYDLINVLAGFAVNGTACGACEMSNRSANEALERFAHSTGITRDVAYEGAKAAK